MSFFSPGSVSGPVIVSPALLTNNPLPELVTSPSAYPLLTASVGCVGVGRLGATKNCFTPVIVSLPLRCTTAASFALMASAAFTYCCVAGGDAEPAEPGVARTAAIGRRRSRRHHPVLGFHR